MNPFAGIGMALMPGAAKQKIKKYVMKAGLSEFPYGWFAISYFIVVGLLFFLFVRLGLSAFMLGIFAIPTLIVALPLVYFTFWLLFEFIIFKRTMAIEEVLPDFLEEVSINLRAGLSFDKALWNSIAPEFGVLEREIEIVAKRVMMGDDTEDALKEFAEKYNSILLQESVDMILVGIRGGGNIAELIDRIVENVKDAYYLRKELIASVTGFVIFIATTAVVISPILFALSFNLMQIIQNLGDKLTTTSTSNLLSFQLASRNINSDDFVNFSKVSVTVISMVSAMIIADLREGSIKAGIKYLVIFVPLSYMIYVGALKLITGLFGVII